MPAVYWGKYGMGTSIKEYSKEIKGGSDGFLKVKLRRDEWLIAGLILVAAFGGFALGRVSAGQGAPTVGIYGAIPAQNASLGSKTPLGEANQAQVVKETTVPVGASKEGAYVASKTGSKYHLPWCPGAQSMREENKVWFATKEDAERAGYKPASNCKGL